MFGRPRQGKYDGNWQTKRDGVQRGVVEIVEVVMIQNDGQLKVTEDRGYDGLCGLTS